MLKDQLPRLFESLTHLAVNRVKHRNEYLNMYSYQRISLSVIVINIALPHGINGTDAGVLWLLYEGFALWAQPTYYIGLARQWFVLNAIFLSGKIPMVIENTCQCEGSIQSLRRDRVLFVFIHQVVHNYVNLSRVHIVCCRY